MAVVMATDVMEAVMARKTADRDIPVREVDTNAFIDVMKDLVNDGKSVSIIVSGNSMSPFLIHGRDRVFFEKPNRELKKGDIVFYQRWNGQYVMHRIYKITEAGYFMVGDAQAEIEGPLKREQIFALITKCQRKGKFLESGDFWWEFFECIWIRCVPMRPVIRKMYGVVSVVLKKITKG